MKKLLLLYLLTSCATPEVVLPGQEAVESVPETPLVIPVTKYHVGQCFYLVDHLTGEGDPRDILKIDSITQMEYIYRWWIYLTHSWAIDTNKGIGRFDLFESMTRDSVCPKG